MRHEPNGSRIGLAILTCALTVALASCGGTDPSAATTGPDGEPGLRRISVNYPTLSGGSWHLFMAKEGGYYEKYGLDVALLFGLHPAGIAMLTSGDGQMADYALEQALIASSRDGSMRMIGSALNKGTFALMASSALTSVADVRGKRYGISQIGDAPYNYSVALLSQFGLTAQDVQWTPVGTGAAGRAAALVGGRVDATLLTAPTYFALEEQGFSKLADLSEFDNIYASKTYLLSNRAIMEHPELPELLLKAHAEGIKRFYEDKGFAVDAYMAYDTEATRADVERIYDNYYQSNMWERIPYVLTGAVDSILEQADRQANPQLETFDFSTVIDNSYVDRLIEQGFFEELYGPEIIEEQERRAALAYR
jgi:ABC-type nitrate/sulfonate/bicarbonate transport system substrate-binding protein